MVARQPLLAEPGLVSLTSESSALFSETWLGGPFERQSQEYTQNEASLHQRNREPGVGDIGG
jgi:hypothetical protein